MGGRAALAQLRSTLLLDATGWVNTSRSKGPTSAADPKNNGG